MSYILDALRKADAERERDPARGIHAQPAAGVAPQATGGVPAWLWPAGVALAGIVAAGVTWQQRAVPPPVRPAAIAAPAKPVAMPVATAVSPPAPAPLPVAPAERSITKVAAVPVAAPQPVPAASAAAAPAAAATPAPDRVYALAELPADVRSELPKLAISGGVHSENAAQRMLVVGGQVLSEGSEVAPGVVLERIRPGNAVLRFRGYRYSVGY